MTKTAAAPKKDAYLGKVVAGRYRLEAQLGEGGMGVVYRARHVLIDRVVALKLIRPDLRAETHLRAWMLREARAANRVDHAHIVEIHDVGETEDGDLYLVMEYLMGTSLSSEIAKGPMTLARAVDILEQMCAALARAHDLGVVHRDLKSDNIMMTSRGGRKDFVKILDFGLAALARDPRLAPKGAVFGTPEYMSPEQARGDDALPVSDLYALGILFYEMVTGQLPFRSADRDTLLEMQKTKVAPNPRALAKDIPEVAEKIILKLLEKDPKNRFRDGHHLQEELKALQRTLPQSWEVQPNEGGPSAPAAPPPPPRAPTPSVVDWSRRAAYFSRMIARAFPSGRVPDEVNTAIDQMWSVSARAARLEGEVASHQRKLDVIERRGRALRAEIGRKVEELAEEESRILRDAAAERERMAKVQKRLEQERILYDQSHREATALERVGGDAQRWRSAFEAATRALASHTVLRDVHKDYEDRCLAKEKTAGDLRRQIEGLRAQLQRYGEALENELAGGRETVAHRVREALSFEKIFTDSSSLLMGQLQGRPEVSELFDEMKREEAAHSMQVASSGSIRADQTGSFKAMG